MVLSHSIRAVSLVVLSAILAAANSALHAEGHIASAETASSAAVSPAANTRSAPALEITSQAESSDSVAIRIKLGSSVQPDSMNIHLNGHDVTDRFSPTDCNGATCDDATLTAADGLNKEKNVLSVVAPHGVSSRYRFDAPSSSTASLQEISNALRASGGSLRAMQSPDQVGSPSVSNPFLPPTISFQTPAKGGWNGQVDPANNPWFTVGTQGYPATTPANCGSPVSADYLVVVLNRQTLAEQTTAPESSPQCFANSAELKSYLTTLTSNDLAVVGTNEFHNADAGLDISAIGGTERKGSPGDGTFPAGIMAIGVGGTTAGSAYEAYYVQKSGYEAVLPFATGTLQEDAYGNYNFQSSDVVEFTVSPNADPTGLSGTSSSIISVQIPASLRGKAENTIYTPPDGKDGYWLLVISRYSLNTNPYSCANQLLPDGVNQLVSNCGTFYPTGSSNSATSNQAYQNLATALNNLNSWQLGILTTVGQAAYGGSKNSIWNVAGFNGNYSGSPNGFTAFSKALSLLGAQPGLTQSLLSPTSAYTLISSPGIGGPLNGNTIESTTELPAQGQTGLVHGILQRNLNGLFMPQQTNQETEAMFTAKGGINSPEFKLTEVSLQQPVEWPSSSTTTLLRGPVATADTLAGQLDAYRYLSYVLLHNIYMPGLTGSHLDDIHYFFTGSINTSINYHYYDPNQIQWPDGDATGPYVLWCAAIDKAANPNDPTCNIAITVNGQAVQLSFTENDFFAVRPQLSLEIHYLTDTLQFLVTGSTNMKDVIAAGNANAGIALTGAAATILGSKLIPAPPTTTVTISWQNIVSMVGGISSVASALPGLGQALGFVSATSKIAPIIAGTASAIGGGASIAAGAGGIHSSSTSQTLPSAFAHFSTTIGDLADGSMEDQLSIGFDTMTDNITSDYGRLSTIGTMTLDSNNPVFFSPNQVAQTISVAALTQAASRNFYLALMPSFYSVHYWPGTSGDATSSANNIPDMGNIWSVSHAGGNDDFYCSAYYLDPQQNDKSYSGPLKGLGATPENATVFYPSLAGTQSIFSNDYSYWPIDYYVIAGTVNGRGSRTPSIQVIDPLLASNLFTTEGLNLPIDEFVTEVGPMSSVWVNAANSNPAGNGNGSVCNARIYPSFGGMPSEPAPNGVTITPRGVSGIVTTTTLTVPSTSTLDEAVTAIATVTAGTSPITSGQIFFVDTGAIVATEPLDSTGTATVSLSNLALGVHSIVAEYSVVGAKNPNYLPSTSSTSTLTVHSAPPGLNVTLSQQSVQVSAGTASPSIAIQVASLAGAAGTVNFSCSGMPSGTSCTFTPQSIQIGAGGTGTSSLVISETATTASTETVSARGLTILSLMPLSLLMMWRIRRGSKALRTLTLLLLLSVTSLAGMVGCGGNAKTPVIQPAGTQTILVTASIGSVTQTVPLSVNFQ